MVCPVSPREAASRGHFSNKKQQFELKILFEVVSIAFFPKHCGEMLLDLVSNANVQKHVSKNIRRISVESTLLMV